MNRLSLRNNQINPKVTWKTKIVLSYFQSKFEGIWWTALEIFNKEQLYKSARSTQRHQKQQIWGWIVISMKLESFRLSCVYQVLIFRRHGLPTWFACTRSSLAEDLAPQSGTKKFMKFHLLWTVLWPLGFAYLSLHKFSRISIRNVLWFEVSNNKVSNSNVHDIEYNKVSLFLQFL